jgi:pSer/pThr/pTyr-binding forkhead associated (FHA) protein
MKNLLPFSDDEKKSDVFWPEPPEREEETTAPPCLVITKGKQKGQEFSIKKEETSLGRTPDNDIQLSSFFISQKHAMILRQGQNFIIRDLKSWRGTMVNGKFILETVLHGGDTIQLGNIILTFIRGN